MATSTADIRLTMRLVLEALREDFAQSRTIAVEEAKKIAADYGKIFGTIKPPKIPAPEVGDPKAPKAPKEPKAPKPPKVEPENEGPRISAVERAANAIAEAEERAAKLREKYEHRATESIEHDIAHLAEKKRALAAAAATEADKAAKAEINAQKKAVQEELSELQNLARERKKLENEHGNAGGHGGGEHEGVGHKLKEVGTVAAGSLLGNLAGQGLEGTIESLKKGAEAVEELKIGLATAGVKAGDMEGALKTLQTQTLANANALGVSRNELQEGTASFLKFGGSFKSMDELADKQRVIAALAKRLNVSMADAAKQLVKGTDDELGLSKIGIIIDKNATSAQRYDIISKKLSGTLDGMKEAANGPLGQFQKFQNTIQVLMETLGNTLLEALAPIASILATVIAPIGDIIKSVIGPIGEALKAVFEPLASVVSALLEPVSAILKAVLLPIVGLITAVLGPLGGLVKSLLQPFLAGITLISNALQPVLASITGKIGIVVQKVIGVVTKMLPVITAAVTPVATVIAKVLTSLEPLLGSWLDIFTAIFPPVLQLGLTLLTVLYPAIAALIGPLGDVLVNVVTLGASLLQALLPVFVALIPPIAELITLLVQGLSGGLAGVVGVVAQVASVLVGGLAAGLQWVIGALVSAVTWVVNAGKSIWEFLEPAFSAVANVIGSVLKPAWDWLSSAFSKMYDQIKTQVVAAWNWISKAIGDAVEWFKRGAKAAGDLIAHLLGFKNLGQVFDAVKAAIAEIGTIVKGAEAGFASLKETISGAFDSLINFDIGGVFDKLVGGFGRAAKAAEEQGRKIEQAHTKLKNALAAAFVDPITVQVDNLAKRFQEAKSPEQIQKAREEAEFGIKHINETITNLRKDTRIPKEDIEEAVGVLESSIKTLEAFGKPEEKKPEGGAGGTGSPKDAHPPKEPGTLDLSSDINSIAKDARAKDGERRLAEIRDQGERELQALRQKYAQEEADATSKQTDLIKKLDLNAAKTKSKVVSVDIKDDSGKIVQKLQTEAEIRAYITDQTAKRIAAIKELADTEYARKSLDLELKSNKEKERQKKEIIANQAELELDQAKYLAEQTGAAVLPILEKSQKAQRDAMVDAHEATLQTAIEGTERYAKESEQIFKDLAAAQKKIEADAKDGKITKDDAAAQLKVATSSALGQLATVRSSILKDTTAEPENVDFAGIRAVQLKNQKETDDQLHTQEKDSREQAYQDELNDIRLHAKSVAELEHKIRLAELRKTLAEEVDAARGNLALVDDAQRKYDAAAAAEEEDYRRKTDGLYATSMDFREGLLEAFLGKLKASLTKEQQLQLDNLKLQEEQLRGSLQRREIDYNTFSSKIADLAKQESKLRGSSEISLAGFIKDVRSNLASALTALATKTSEKIDTDLEAWQKKDLDRRAKDEVARRKGLGKDIAAEKESAQERDKILFGLAASAGESLAALALSTGLTAKKAGTALLSLAFESVKRLVAIYLPGILLSNISFLGPIFGPIAAAATTGIAEGLISAAQGALHLKDGAVDIQGPGTSTSDSIPILGSRGESMVNAAATHAGGPAGKTNREALSWVNRARRPLADFFRDEPALYPAVRVRELPSAHSAELAAQHRSSLTSQALAISALQKQLDLQAETNEAFRNDVKEMHSTLKENRRFTAEIARQGREKQEPPSLPRPISMSRV